MTSTKRTPRFGKTTMIERVHTASEDSARFNVYSAPQPMPGRKIGYDPERGHYVFLDDGSTERCTIELAIGIFVAATTAGSSEREREICEIACRCFDAARMNMMDGKRGRPKGSKTKNDRDRQAVEWGKAQAARAPRPRPYAYARTAVLDGRAGKLTGEQIENAIRRIGGKIKRSTAG